MAEIGIKIVGEDQASFAFRAVSDSARATASEVSSLGDSWTNMSNVISTGVVKAQAIIGLFQGAMTAAGNATQGIRSFVDSSVQMNATLESTRGSFSVLLGGVDNANKMLGEMRLAAQTTAMSFEEFRNAGKYLLGFQFEAKDVVQITKDIGAAVYALGAKDQGGMERIIRALGQMKAQGRVSREELNQLAEVGVPALKMLADSFGVTTMEMSQMVRKGTVPVEQAISGLIGQFRALYGATGTSMANNFAVMSSNLQDFIDQAKIAIGGGIFAETRRQLQELTGVVSSPVFLRLAEQIGTKLGNSFRNLNDTAILPTIRAVSQFMEALNLRNPNPAILELTSNLNNIFGQLVGQYFGPTGVSAVRNFTAVLGQLGVAASTLLKGGNIYDVFNQLSKIGQDTAAGRFVASLVQEFANLQTSLQQLQQYLSPIVNTILSEFGKLSQSDFVKGILKSLDDLFTVTDSKGNTFRLQMGEIVSFINVSVQNIASSLERFGTLFMNALDGGKVQPLVQAISGFLGNVVSNIDTWGAQALDAIVGWLGKIFDPNFDGARLEGRVGDIIGNLKLIILQLGDAFADSLGNGLFPKLSPRLNAIGEYLQSQFGIVAQGLGNYLADRLPIAFQMGFNAIGAAWSNWNDNWKKQLFNDVTETIGAPIDQILKNMGLEGKVTAAIQGVWSGSVYTELNDRITNTNNNLKEQQALLREQMNNLPSIGQYFNGLGDITSLTGAFAQIQDSSSGPAIQAGRAIISGVATGVSSQMPSVANTIDQQATSSLSQLANSLATSSSVSSAWQNVGYSLATAVSRGYNSGYQEMIANIQTTLGIPKITEQIAENTADIASISSTIRSHVTATQLHSSGRAAPAPPAGGGNGEGVVSGASIVGRASGGNQPPGGGPSGVLYTVNNNITVNTDERSGKAVENAASYVFLRGALNPSRR